MHVHRSDQQTQLSDANNSVDIQYYYKHATVLAGCSVYITSVQREPTGCVIQNYLGDSHELGGCS